MESTLKRIARRLLAKVPWIYLFVLKTFHRGSVEKYFYLSIVQQGDVVIDVGANVGYFTMLFADLTGKRGQVHAFEPIPSTFEELLRNIRRFPGYKGVYLNCASVGDSQRRTAMLLPRDDHGQAALIALSLATSPAMKSAGKYWELSVDAYPEMQQGVAILSSSKHKQAAQAFIDSPKRIVRSDKLRLAAAELVQAFGDLGFPGLDAIRIRFSIEAGENILCQFGALLCGQLQCNIQSVFESGRRHGGLQ